MLPPAASRGLRALPSAEVAEIARVFDLRGAPGRYLNSAAADEASATTLAAAAMRARFARENMMALA